MLKRSVEKEFGDQFAYRKVPMVFLEVGTAGQGVANIRVDYAMGVNATMVHLAVRIGRSAFLHSLGGHAIDEDEHLVELGDQDGGAPTALISP